MIAALSLWLAPSGLAQGPTAAQAAGGTLEVSDGQTTYTATLQPYDGRAGHFELWSQQGDGTFAVLTPDAPRTLIGRLPDVPGASVTALRRGEGATFYRVFFEDGKEWINEGGATTIRFAPPTATSWPHFVPSPHEGELGLVAADVGVDLPHDVFAGTHGSEPAAALEMIEYSILNAGLLHLRDAGVMHRVGRVVLRASPTRDPYEGLTTHGQHLDTLIAEWENVLPAGDHDLALVVRGTGGGGLATTGVGAPSEGYTSNDATAAGDFSVVWRHEAAHNWTVGHFDGGAPAGATINAGNSLARLSGPEQALVQRYRDRRLAALDAVAPFAIPLPPRAATDQLYHSASSPTALIDVLGNDHDANGDALELVSVTPGSELDLGGSAQIAPGAGPDGRDAVRYTAPAVPSATSAIDRFTYRVRDASGQEAIGKVFVRLADFADEYLADFDGATDGLDDGSFVSNVSESPSVQFVDGVLELTPDELYRQGAFTVPLTGLGQGVTVSFEFRIDAQASTADVLAVNLGEPVPVPNSTTTSKFSRGLTFELDTWIGNRVRLLVDQEILPDQEYSLGFDPADGQWRTLTVSWRPMPPPSDGQITVTLDGDALFDGVETPGFVPGPQDMVGITARTGGLSQRVRIDDVRVQRVGQSTPDEPGARADVVALDPNRPNPVRAATTIRFSTRDDGPVRLDVYDALGRLVATLADEVRPAGEHHVQWSPAEWGAASGVYAYRLTTAGQQIVRRMVVLD